MQDAIQEQTVQREKGEHYSYKTPASKTLRAMQRYKRTADHSLMMLAILAFAPSFRKATEKESDATWDLLETRILTNRESLEYFAKVRGSQWKELLNRDTALAKSLVKRPEVLVEMFPGERVEHPHTRVIPQQGGELRVPTCGVYYQTNIDECVFDEDLWTTCDEMYGKPEGWPTGMEYPSNPSLRMPGEKCDNCGSTFLATCIERSCDKNFTKPLIELFDAGERGVGVRTLQAIKANDILDEYVAEIVPTGPAYGESWHLDSVYGWDISIPINGKANYLYSLKGAEIGTWLRFVNHSCEESVKGAIRVFGNRRRMVYIATRDIAPFEELLVNYGDDYFGAELDRWCKCGEETCRYSEPIALVEQKPKKRRIRR